MRCAGVGILIPRRSGAWQESMIACIEALLTLLQKPVKKAWLFHAIFYFFHIGIAQPKMMANFMD